MIGERKSAFFKIVEPACIIADLELLMISLIQLHQLMDSAMRVVTEFVFSHGSQVTTCPFLRNGRPCAGEL